MARPAHLARVTRVEPIATPKARCAWLCKHSCGFFVVQWFFSPEPTSRGPDYSLMTILRTGKSAGGLTAEAAQPPRRRGGGQHSTGNCLLYLTPCHFREGRSRELGASLPTIVSFVVGKTTENSHQNVRCELHLRIPIVLSKFCS